MATSSESVLILGCGFGGLWAAQALRKAPVQVTVLDRTNHHLFSPLLYQVATAGLSAPSIAGPIRHILADQRNTTVLLGEATRDPSGRRRCCWRTASAIAYDQLIVATGMTDSYFGHDEWAPFAPGLKTLDDALEIRRRVLIAFERAEAETDPARRAAWLTFAVVGGGADRRRARRHLRRDRAPHAARRIPAHRPAAARVVLIEGGRACCRSIRPTSRARRSGSSSASA